MQLGCVWCIFSKFNQNSSKMLYNKIMHNIMLYNHFLLLRRQLVTLIIALGIIPCGYAARDGSIGLSSTGSMKISLVVLPRAQIQHLKDLAINLVEHNRLTVEKTQTSACVYGGSRGGGYYLVANVYHQSHADNYKLRPSMLPLQSKQLLPAFTISARNNPHTLSYHLSAKDFNDKTFRSIIPSSPLYLNGAKRLRCKNATNLDIKMQLDKNSQPIPGESYYGAVYVLIAPQ